MSKTFSVLIIISISLGIKIGLQPAETPHSQMNWCVDTVQYT